QDAAYAGLRIHPELGIEDACPAVAARTAQAWIAGALSHLHRHAEGVAPRADRKLLAESGYRGGLRLDPDLAGEVLVHQGHGLAAQQSLPVRRHAVAQQ